MNTRTPKGIFITGSDTGVGKTIVSCAIAAGLRRRGVRVGVFKPVETGCALRAGRLEAADASKLVAAAGGEQAIDSAIGRAFELTAAPLVAAESVGAHIDPLELVAAFTRVAARYDFTIVEGAGGLLVPIADGCTFLDLARQLALPVACVVGSRLGCVNHALLTLRTLLHAGVATSGFVVNELSPHREGEPTAESNRAVIERFAAQKDLGLFPCIAEGERESWEHLGALAEQHLDLGRLLSGAA